MTHTVAAATRGEGSYVIVPNFQKDFFHGDAGQSGYKTTVTLNAENDCKIPGFPPADVVTKGTRLAVHNAVSCF